MTEGLTSLLAYFASWAALTGGVWTLFSRAESVTSTSARTEIAKWLQEADPAKSVSNWPQQFARVFDSVFGERHLSRRCFAMSAVASFASVLIVILLWGALRPNQFFAFLTGEFYWKEILVGLAFFAVLNLLPDYLSLLESRYVIKLMQRGRSLARMILLLLLDLLVTVGIGFAAWMLLSLPVMSRETSWQIFVERILPLTASRVGGEGWGAAGVFFYSTFFTSVWVWLFAISTQAVRLAEYFGIGLNRLKWLLDIQQKPIQSLGVMSILLLTFAYLFIPFFLE